jgi:putative molybdopterin biosynthesis protein
VGQGREVDSLEMEDRLKRIGSVTSSNSLLLCCGHPVIRVLLHLIRSASVLARRSNTKSRLLCVPEVAEQLRVSREGAYELCREGLLPAVRLGRQVRIDPDELRAWIQSGGSPFADKTSSGARQAAKKGPR